MSLPHPGPHLRVGPGSDPGRQAGRREGSVRGQDSLVPRAAQRSSGFPLPQLSVPRSPLCPEPLLRAEPGPGKQLAPVCLRAPSHPRPEGGTAVAPPAPEAALAPVASHCPVSGLPAWPSPPAPSVSGHLCHLHGSAPASSPASSPANRALSSLPAGLPPPLPFLPLSVLHRVRCLCVRGLCT